MANIGFIGLGRMGGAMRRNLVKAGHDVTVFDLDADAVTALVDAGARPATSGRDAARGAGFVFTMLTVGQIVEDAVFGPDGIADGISPEALYIDRSTILPDDTRRIPAGSAGDSPNGASP